MKRKIKEYRDSFNEWSKEPIIISFYGIPIMTNKFTLFLISLILLDIVLVLIEYMPNITL